MNAPKNCKNTAKLYQVKFDSLAQASENHDAVIFST